MAATCRIWIGVIRMKLGFIGCGNMAKAMLGGILKNGVCRKGEILASTRTQASREKTADDCGIRVTGDNREVAQYADVIVLAVKPVFYEEVIRQIRDVTDEKKIMISIAPGKTLAWLEEKFEKKVKLVRCMPNTPALVGEGMTGVCGNDAVTDQEMEEVLGILESCGKAEVLPEHLIDVVVSVSGSSPAYVFLFIEAMADAAVADGMPRAQAYRFAAQAVLGSAKMVLETGKHPGELKDMVCSPGGTTIEAVRVLEEKGMRSAVIEAMKACVAKGRQM